MKKCLSITGFTVLTLLQGISVAHSAPIIFQDNFNRANSTSVGNGWLENEGTGSVGINDNHLHFDNPNSLSSRPIVSHSFTSVNSGIISLSYDFDWARIGNDDSYAVFMQLGDSTVMSDTQSANGLLDDGVAVNLAWTEIGGIHESLGYVQDGNFTHVDQIEGLNSIQVITNLDSGLYSVLVNGSEQAANISFDKNLSTIDMVRFYTTEMATSSFSGRNFDNLEVTAVPIPAAAWLFLSALGGLGIIRRKRS